MNVFIVYAHPTPHSLNGLLKDFTVKRLEDAGHVVQVSDLYAMNWKTTLDANDSIKQQEDEPFHPMHSSQYAFMQGTQSQDITDEQDKLRWADAVILQFPLWWFSMPAILKGWVDRVYACGFAYGVGEHSDTHWGDRYGEGAMAGKRAMLLVTAGGWESHYSERGVNGSINELLFPIQHGTLYYPGFDVLPPHLIYQTRKMDQSKLTQIYQELGERLDNLWKIEPIRFRPQNGGEYSIPELILKPEFAPEEKGLSIHSK